MQFGFYPRRNTRQVADCNPCLYKGTFSMLRKLNAPAIHLDCMPLLLSSSKLMTLSHGKPRSI